MKSIVGFILHSEQFADWLSQFFAGFIIMWLGSRVSDVRLGIQLPKQLIPLARFLGTPAEIRKNRQIVDGGILAIQIIGFSMCLFSFYV